MAYIGLLLAPIILALALFLTPATRDGTASALHDSGTRIVDVARSAFDELRNGPDILSRIATLQRRLAAYVLRQAAGQLDNK